MGLEVELGPVAGGGVRRPSATSRPRPGSPSAARCRPGRPGASPAAAHVPRRRVSGSSASGGSAPAGRQGELLAPTADLGDPLAAQVVAPTLEHGEGEVAAARAAATRGRSLVASWSCRALVAVATTTRWPEQDGGDQVGQRLAGAGAGLHDQVAPVGDGPAHGLGHLACWPGRDSPPPGRAAATRARVRRSPRRSSTDPIGGAGRLRGHRRPAPPTVGADVTPSPVSATPRPGPTATPSPTTTMTHRRHGAGSRRPIAAADLAADDRPGGDEPGHRPRDVGGGDEEDPGHGVDHEGQARSWCR